MPWWGALVFIAALFGLLFGSFANVVIWRLPRGESLVAPGSHCPQCGHAIRWYDNIPVLSWLVLRGRCRDCGAPIPARYPLVELASGVLFALAVVRFGATPQALVAAAVFWLLLVLAVIDLDHMRLPNALVATLGGIALAGALVFELAGVPLTPLVGVSASGIFSHPLAVALAGALIGAGFSGAVAAAYAGLRKRSGLGMGDVKLLGALGLAIGPYVLLALFAGSVLGVAGWAIGSKARGREGARIPFGPFVAAGGLIAALAGPEMLGWYVRLAGLS